MLERIYLWISATIFFVVAMAHPVRSIFLVPIIIAGWPLPMWISYLGLAGALGLSLWGWLALFRTQHRLPDEP